MSNQRLADVNHNIWVGLENLSDAKVMAYVKKHFITIPDSQNNIDVIVKQELADQPKSCEGCEQYETQYDCQTCINFSHYQARK